jgi:hypothetical protein
MKRCGEFMLGLLAAVVVVPSLAREPVTIALLKDRAAEDAATPEGKAYLKDGFIRPPHDGFAIYLPAKLTEPGTERRSSAPTQGDPSKQ